MTPQRAAARLSTSRLHCGLAQGSLLLGSTLFPSLSPCVTSCTLSALQIHTALLETPSPAPLLVLCLCRSCRRPISIPSMRSVCYARCVVSSPSSQSDVCAGFVCCDSFQVGVLALLPRLVGSSRSCSSCACISSSLSPTISRRGWY
jgi:hypothetical protein